MSTNSPHDPQSAIRRDPLEVLADEFIQRYRRGEQPSISEYADQHPDLAEQIQRMFPALVMMEDLAPAESDLCFPELAQDASAGLLPETLGDYRIIREIGRGGMGVVYEAEQQSLGRRVALKILVAHAPQNANQKMRFEREARTAARLHHTNIVPVFGVGQHAGMQYYVMQFIAGIGLHDVLVELKSLRERGSTAPSSSIGESAAAADRQQPSVQQYSAPLVAQSLLTGQFSRKSDQLPNRNPGSEAEQIGGPDRRLTGSVAAAQQEPVATTSLPQTEPNRSRASRTQSSLECAGLPGTSGDFSGSRSSRNIYWRSVVSIGIQVANALDYAHEAGIVHRDIKPSNLLLDTHGTVWVTDFGLAKAKNEHDLTETGDVLGTLRYMPPEAFEGYSDARSDLYSLGLTLYELLCLQPGFDDTDRHRLIRQLTTRSPERLRRIDPHIPRDLETIVHKAIDRVPAHRYQTAQELADDLQRYLDNEPVRARRTPTSVRFGRWCRRNPMGATVAALLLICLIAAATAARVFLAQSEENAELAAHEHALREQADVLRQQAESALGQAQQQHARAEANFAKARSAVDDFFTTLSQSQLVHVPGMQPLRQQLLTRALAYYEDFIEQRADEPQLRKELADAQLGLARISSELGGPEYREAFREALTQYRELHREYPDDAEIQYGLAMCDFWLDSYVPAIDELESLLKSDPGNSEYKRALGQALNSLAVRQDEEQNYAAALDLHQRALFLRLELLQADPEAPEIHADVGSTLNNIGVLLARQQRYEEALTLYRQAAEHDAFAFERDPGVVLYGRYLALTCVNIAYQEERAGRSKEAERWFRKAAEVRMQLASTNPEIAGLQSDAYDTWRLLAEHLNAHEQPAAAASALRRAADVLQRLPQRSGSDLFNLARVYALAAATRSRALGDEEPNAAQLAEGEHLADLAVNALQRAVDAGFHTEERLRNETDLESLRGRPEFEELLVLVRTLGTSQPTDTGPASEAQEESGFDLAEVQYSIGVLKTLFDETDSAREALRKSTTTLQERLVEHPDDRLLRLKLARSHKALADLAWNTSRYADADAHWNDVFAVLEAGDDEQLETEQAQAYHDYGTLLARAGLLDEAEPYLVAAIERDSNGGDRWRRGVCLVHLEAGQSKAAFEAAWQEVEHIGNHKFPGTAASAVLLPLLVPECLTDKHIHRLLELSESIWRRAETGQWTQRTYGLAAYRAGQYEKALRVTQSLSGRDSSIQCGFIRAMALYRLGRPEEARQELATTRELQLQREAYAYKPAGTGILRSDWWLWIIADRLRRESEMLIAGESSPQYPLETLHRARNYARLGHSGRAKELFDLAVKHAPENGLVHVMRIRFLAESGLVPQAGLEFQEARERFLESGPDPRYQAAHQWRQLATTARLCGARKAATEAFAESVAVQSQAIRQQPEQVGLRQGLKLMLGDLTTELAEIADEKSLRAVHGKQRQLYEQLGINPLAAFQGHSSPYVWSVSVLSDGKRALSGGQDGFVRLWDLPTGRELRQFEHPGPVSRVACLSGGNEFLTAAYDTTLRLWNADTGKLVRTFHGHTDHIWALAVSPDGTRVLSGGEDETLRVWKPATGELLRTIPTSGSVRCVAFSPDGRQGLSGNFVADSFDVSVWDVGTGRELRRLTAHEQSVYALAFSQDGERIITGDRGGLLVLWDPANGRELHRWNGDWGEVRVATFVSDSHRVLVGTSDGSLLLLDTDTGTVQQRLRGSVRHHDLAILPNGYQILTADGDSSSRVWSMPLLAPPDRAAELILRQLEALQSAPELLAPVAEQAARVDAVIERLLMLRPADVQLQVARAGRLAEQGQWDDAAATLQQLQDSSQYDEPLITQWWVSGPYGGDMHRVTLFFDPAANLDPMTPQNPSDDSLWKLAWKPASVQPNGRLNLLGETEKNPEARFCATYALTRIYALREQARLFQFRADNNAILWLNGQPLNIPQFPLAVEFPVELPLRRGWNTLLVKVINYDGGSWLQVHPVSDAHIPTGERQRRLVQAALVRGQWKLAFERWRTLHTNAESSAVVHPAWDPNLSGLFERTANHHEQNLLLQAAAAWESGERSTAERLYREAISSKPQDYLKNRRLSSLRGYVEQKLNLAQQLTADIEANPQSASAWRSRASFHVRHGHRADAASDFRTAISHSPPTLLEQGWTWSRTIILPGAAAVTHGSNDGVLYVGTRNSGETDGVFRVDPDDRVTRLTDAERVSGIVMHPQTGDVFFAETDRGQIYRIDHETQQRELWISRFRAGDSDPSGMAVLSSSIPLKHFDAGGLLVVDCGWGDADSLYGVSHQKPDTHVLLYRDGTDRGPLIHPVDVTSGPTGIYVVDTGEAATGQILRYDENGRFSALLTSEELQTPIGITRDPLTGDLLVADVNRDALLRTHPTNGLLRTVFGNLGLSHDVYSGVSISPDGREIAIASPQAAAVFTFTRDTATLAILEAQRLTETGDWSGAAKVLDETRAATSKPVVMQTCWWVTGPYPELGKGQTHFAPADNLDPFRAVQASDSDALAPNWQRVPPDRTGLDFVKLFPDKALKNSTSYALTRFYATDPHTLLYHFDVDDRMTLWINGKSVELRNASQEMPVQIALVPGWNTVLVKVWNSYGKYFLKAQEVRREQISPIDWKRMNAHAAILCGDIAAACEPLDAVLAELPDDVQCLLLRAEVRLHQGERSAAEADLNRATQLDPSPDTFKRAALLCDRFQMWEPAVRHYTAFLDLDPTVHSNYYRRSICLHHLRKYEQAMADINKALGLQRDASYLIHRASIHVDRGQFDDALQDCKDAQNLGASGFWLHNIRGRASFGLQDYRSALKEMELALQLNPDAPIVRRLHREAQEHLDAKRPPVELQAELEDALIEAPDDIFLLERLAALHRRQQSWKPAEQIWSRIIDLAPNHERAWFQRALIRYPALDELDQALADVSHSIALRRAPVRLTHRAWLQLEKGDYKQALADCNEAYAAGLRDFFLFARRSHARFALGDFIGALDDAREAVRINPKDAYSRQRFEIAEKAMKARNADGASPSQPEDETMPDEH